MMKRDPIADRPTMEEDDSPVTMTYTDIEANDLQHVTPRWFRHVVRWTSPAWYIFLAFLLLVFIYCIIALAFSRDKA